MPVLMSHILMVLSLDPDSRKGPGLPLFLVYRKLCLKLYYAFDGSSKRRNEADPFPVILFSTKIRSYNSLQQVNPYWKSWVAGTGTNARRITQPVKRNGYLSCWFHKPSNTLNTHLPTARHPLLTVNTAQVPHLRTRMKLSHIFVFTFFIKCNEAGLRISENFLLWSDFCVCPCTGVTTGRALTCPRCAGKVLPCGLCPIPPAGGRGRHHCRAHRATRTTHGLSL